MGEKGGGFLSSPALRVLDVRCHCHFVICPGLIGSIEIYIQLKETVGFWNFEVVVYAGCDLSLNTYRGTQCSDNV